VADVCEIYKPFRERFPKKVESLPKAASIPANLESKYPAARISLIITEAMRFLLLCRKPSGTLHSSRRTA
jgi:hypothetical protein